MRSRKRVVVAGLGDSGVLAAIRGAFRFPAWVFDKVLLPVVVGWGYYRGVRSNDPLAQLAGSPERTSRP